MCRATLNIDKLTSRDGASTVAELIVGGSEDTCCSFDGGPKHAEEYKERVTLGFQTTSKEKPAYAARL